MLTRTSIEEANRHLKALHQKIVDLEMLVKDQREALVGKDSFIHTKIQELKSQDMSIKELKERLALEKVNSGRLEYKVLEQETELQQLRRSNAMFAEVLKFLPEMKSLVNHMDVAVSSKAVVVEEVDTSQCNTSSHSAADGDIHDYDETVDAHSQEASPEPSETTKMARGFVKQHRQKQFSISEDDTTDSIFPESPEATGKEFYL